MPKSPTQLSLDLPWPPSTNTYYRNFRGHMVLSAKGRQFKKDVAEIVSAKGCKIEGRLSLFIRLFPPDRRKFDIDGRIKALQDALQDAGVFDNDEQIDHLEVVRGPILKGGKCSIVLAVHET